MTKRIRAELYKALRRTYLRVLLALSGLFSLGAVLSIRWLRDNLEPLVSPDLGAAVAFLFVGLPAGLYLTVFGSDLIFSNQYKYHTLKNEVSFGIPRTGSYLSRLAAAAIIMAMQYLVLVGVFLLAGWFLLGADGAAPEYPLSQSLPAFGLASLAALPLWLGALSLAMALVFLIRSDNLAMFFYFMLLFLLPQGLSVLGQLFHPVFAQLHGLTLNAAMGALTADGEIQLLLRHSGLSAGLTARCWLTGLSWTAGTTALGLAGFSRRELP